MKIYKLNLYRAESKERPTDILETVTSGINCDSEPIKTITTKEEAMKELSKYTSTAYRSGGLWLIECYAVQELDIDEDGEETAYYDIYPAAEIIKD